MVLQHDEMLLMYNSPTGAKLILRSQASHNMHSAHART